MTTENDFWFGIDIAAKMELRLLERVYDAITAAKEDAKRSLERAGDYPHSTALYPSYHGGDGAELSQIYIRFYLYELNKLLKENHDKTQNAEYRSRTLIDIYNATLADNKEHLVKSDRDLKEPLKK